MRFFGNQLRIGLGRLSLGFALAGTLIATNHPCLAAAVPAARGSTVITAVIAPVRSILIDERGTIQQVVSNTQENVVPKVYQDSFDSTPITLSPEVSRQYQKIMPKLNTRHTGTIYEALRWSRPHPTTVNWLGPADREGLLLAGTSRFVAAR